MPTDHPAPLAGEQGTALAELIAERFRVLGDPTRIRLLDALRDGSATVGELHRAVGSSQQNVSKHLGVLLRSGLVRLDREGGFSRYAIADESVFELCEQVCGGMRRQLAGLDEVLHGASLR